MDNRTRALSQAISVDGWIGKFDEDGTANVHADIVFRNGAFGDDPEALIRFKIAVKRAEILLRIPDHEPVRIVRESVRRTTSKVVGKETISKKKTKGYGLSLLGKLSPKPEASASAEATYQNSDAVETSFERETREFVEQHFTSPDGHYAWEVARHPDLDGAHLQGSPWDAVHEPRLKIKRKGSKDDSEITIIIEVRCAREDIEIIDLEQKDSEKNRIFRTKKNRDVHLAAAEQLIKNELLKVGFLEIPDLSEKNARLMIADKVILQED